MRILRQPKGDIFLLTDPLARAMAAGGKPHTKYVTHIHGALSPCVLVALQQCGISALQ